MASFCDIFAENEMDDEGVTMLTEIFDNESDDDNSEEAADEIKSMQVEGDYLSRKTGSFHNTSTSQTNKMRTSTEG